MNQRTFENKVLLITGADGEIGTALLEEITARKASKIYATGIAIDRLNQLACRFPTKVQPIFIDVTEEESIRRAAEICKDVDILINNAGVELKSDFIGENAGNKALLEMKINYIGVLTMINSFLPVLQKKDSSQILNILSIGSSVMIKRIATYCASKSATHLLTQALRPELKPLHIDLIGVYPGYVDSAMSSDVQGDKITLSDLAKAICDGFEEGVLDIFPDKMSQDFFQKNPIHVSYLT